MTFVPKVPKRVEDLFELAKGDNNTAMEAVLEDGTRLYLSEGYAMNYPSPWPLYYHLALATPAVRVWMEETYAQAREFVREIDPDLLEQRSDVWGELQTFFGPYIRIGGLELGVKPAIGRRVTTGTTVAVRQERTFDYHFPSPIVQFNPLDQLPDSYPQP